MKSAKVFSLVFSLLYIFLSDYLVECYSRGAGDIACDHRHNYASLTPGHGVSPQNSPSPYEVLITEDLNAHDDTQHHPIQLTLRTKTGQRFGGFLLVAMDGNGSFVGHFETSDASKSDYVQRKCGGTALTHTLSWRNSAETSLDITWRPPPKLWTGYVTFLCTFVQSKTVFWTRVEATQQASLALAMSAGVAPPPGWTPPPTEKTTTPEVFSLPAQVQTTPKLVQPSTEAVQVPVETTPSTTQSTPLNTTTVSASTTAGTPVQLQEQTTMKEAVSSGCTNSSTLDCLKRRIVSKIHFLVEDLENLKRYITSSSLTTTSST